ncbi:MAG: ABC transporter permease [Acidobacteriota bacterium]|nr:ABC transporter permease [Acidobacteriota bacterium]
MKLFSLMWKNALRNPRRTVLTILSIAVSIFLIATLEAVLQNIYHPKSVGGSAQLTLVVHRATGITESMPLSYRGQIVAVPGVKYVVGQQWFGGQYIDARNFFANFAVDTDDFAKVFDNYTIAPDQLAAWKSQRTAALVGVELMQKYHWKLGQTITLTHAVFPVNAELTIRGVYSDPTDPSQDLSLYFHYDYLNEMMDEMNQVGSFIVRVDNAGDVPKVAAAVDAHFRNSPFETKTETLHSFLLSFVSMLGNLNLLLTVVSLAVVFTILLIVGNTMAMSIRERTGEVAVLKTLGFRRNTILGLLVGESLVVALLGGIIGAVGAKLVFAFIQATYSTAKPLGFAFALLIAAAAAYGAWLLFAVSGPGRTSARVARIAATAIGAIIGFAVGIVFYMGVGGITSSGFFLANLQVPLIVVAGCLGVAVVVGIVSAILPAARASRVKIAEALRYVG